MIRNDNDTLLLLTKKIASLSRRRQLIKASRIINSFGSYVFVISEKIVVNCPGYPIDIALVVG